MKAQQSIEPLTVRLLVVAVLLAALTLAALGTIVNNDFIALDDADYITGTAWSRAA